VHHQAKFRPGKKGISKGGRKKKKGSQAHIAVCCTWILLDTEGNEDKHGGRTWITKASAKEVSRTFLRRARKKKHKKKSREKRERNL